MKNNLGWIILAAVLSMGAYRALTVTSTSNVRVEAAMFGGSTQFSNCTSNPCTIYQQTGGFSSIGWAGTTGRYTFNFPSGTFSSAPDCTCICKSHVTSRAICELNTDFSQTATQIVVETWDPVGPTIRNAVCSVTCVGIR